MTELEELTQEVKTLGTKLAQIWDLLNEHISTSVIDKVKPQPDEAKGGVEAKYVEELNELWELYRAEKDPVQRRMLLDKIKMLEARVNKRPGAGVVKPR